jgi:hypothetical protein
MFVSFDEMLLLLRFTTSTPQAASFRCADDARAVEVSLFFLSIARLA